MIMADLSYERSLFYVVYKSRVSACRLRKELINLNLYLFA